MMWILLFGSIVISYRDLNMIYDYVVAQIE